MWFSERHELVVGQTHRVPERPGYLLELICGKDVVPRGNRRVRRKQARRADLRFRLCRGEPCCRQLAHALDEHEGRVPLVRVPDIRLKAEGTQETDAADAEHPLLPQAPFRRTRVQSRRQLPVACIIGLEVGIEQVNGNPPYHDAPRADPDFATRDGDRDDARLAVRAVHPGDGVHGGIDGIVGIALPSIQADVLIEIAAVIVQADANQRDAQVGRFLAMVAREHAEAAGIDRQ